ncbi:MAG: hypothetical protein JXB29_07640 [Sedimentisphaerales bacterium]|nr:hypothetical protein [Sedimentisphaerales bacterium]
MAEDKTNMDVNMLYDFVLALASSGTTISNYLDICEQLWNHPFHRPWLIAALMRKAGTLNEEPDKACIDFLADKTFKAMGFATLAESPKQDDIAEFLSTIIQLMPDDAWAKPMELWQTLLNSLAQEYGVTYPQGSENEHLSSDSKARELAALFTEAISSPWTKTLEQRLENWREDRNYTWLVALRHSKGLDRVLEATRHQEATIASLNAPDLLEVMRRMSPFEGRCFLVLHETTSEKSILTDPIIDSATSAITWRFIIKVPVSVNIDIVIAKQAVGCMSLTRSPEGNIIVSEATGICATLTAELPTTLVPMRAAAVKVKKYVPITPILKGTLEAVPDGLIIEIKWQIAEPK